MQLGEVIKHYRKKQGLKQYEFAELLDVSSAYISMIETNRKHPSFDLLKDIADMLGLLVSHILFIAEHNLQEQEIASVDKYYLMMTQAIIRDLNPIFIIDPKEF